jgi:hypothetical protein
VNRSDLVAAMIDEQFQGGVEERLRWAVLTVRG